MNISEPEIRLKRLIDKDGFFVEDVFTSETSDFLIETKLPDGMFSPRWNGEEWDETDTEARDLNRKASLLDSLQELCDTKTQEAKRYISGSYVTPEQFERYNEKFLIAKSYIENGDYSDNLALEASLNGVSIDDLASFIVEKGNAYTNALMTFNSRIEAFRVMLSKLINDGKYDKAEALIEKAELLDAGSTDEDIKSLLLGEPE